MLFSEEEFKNSIIKCNNSLTPGPDKLSWRYFKVIVNDSSCLKSFVNIANVCINLGYWLIHFKISLSIIIPKPNKASHDSPKIFRPIVLLNTLSKLIEKVISERLQFQLISKNIIHSYQLDELKQWSTMNTEVILTYFIHAGWVKNLSTSIFVRSTVWSTYIVPARCQS